MSPAPRGRKKKSMCKFIHRRMEMITFEDGTIEELPAYWCDLLAEGVPCPFTGKWCPMKQYIEEAVEGIRVRPDGSFIEVHDPELESALNEFYGDGND